MKNIDIQASRLHCSAATRGSTVVASDDTSVPGKKIYAHKHI
jgi:hypothetical protein